MARGVLAVQMLKLVAGDESGNSCTIASDAVLCRDYEAVALTETTRATLLPWVAGLRDPFTITTDRPEGQPLEVSGFAPCLALAPGSPMSASA